MTFQKKCQRSACAPCDLCLLWTGVAKQSRARVGIEVISVFQFGDCFTYSVDELPKNDPEYTMHIEEVPKAQLNVMRII